MFSLNVLISFTYQRMFTRVVGACSYLEGFAVVPPFPQFCFCGLLSVVNRGPKILNIENSRKKQFISCKLHAILCSMMESHTVLVHPESSLSPASPHCICFLPVSHLGYQIDCLGVAVLVFQVTFILFSNGPKVQE